MKQNSFALFCLIVSCIVGVGIYTGQEVLAYFGRASLVGFVCAAISGCAFFFILKLCLNLSFNTVYKKLCQKKWFKVLCNVIYIIVAGAMLSALRFIFGSFAVPVVVCVVGAAFSGRLEKLFEKLNIFFCFIMLGIIMFITVANCAPGYITVFSKVKLPFLKGILFASFNLFICAPMLAKKGEELNEKQVFKISLFSAIIFFVLIVFSMLALTHCKNVLPFFDLAGKSIVYMAVLCLSAITTLFGVFVSSKRLTKNSTLYLTSAVCALFISMLPFDSIVNVFYIGSSLFAFYFFGRLILFSK